jgi:hypothetical protein
VLHVILSHHAGDLAQAVIIGAGIAVLAVVAWRYSRRPDYRKIHRLERQLGYRDLTAIPRRRGRRR